MDPTTIASILVGCIAALSAYASQRASSKASKQSATTVSRLDMETEAYERARSYDTETIRRQDEELLELRLSNKELETELLLTKTELRGLKNEMRNCLERVMLLEKG